MATTNITITDDWTQVADASDDPVLITGVSQDPVEFATTAGGAPTVERGHRLGSMASGEGITRTLLGSGDIYARAASGKANLVVSK